ncbi:MAG TPA: hypothetical protein VLK84_06400, partial [Longimicrobium sp.]|nr:hypothetical protein [Longimicrobium sp.]
MPPSFRPIHTRRATRILLAAAALLAAPAALRAQDDAHGAHSHAPVLGSVTFANSGAAAAQEPFLRGIALTHSFEYNEAVRAFREAMAADSLFALPYWAEALTYSHVVWGEENLEGGRAALARLAPTPEARIAKARTPGERAFAGAVEALFAEGDQVTRVRGFADSMRAWSTRMPDDPEAHAFTALATMVQSFVTRDEALAAEISAEAAMHAQRVLDENPRHPGAAHYMIHANDSPAMAQQGLAAARAYAAIAPDAQHALHMPSHIFLPLGMWDDMLASNQRSWAVARQEAIAAGAPGWYTDFHSLNWMQYAYLQQGRWAEARALVDTARALTAEPIRNPASRHVDASYALEQLAFRYATETGRWDVWPADSVGMRWNDPALSQRARGMSSASAYQRAVAAMRMRGDTMPAVATARAFREAAAAASPPNASLERFAAQLEALVMQARGDEAGYVAALQAQLPANRVPRRRSMTPQTTLVISEELGAALLQAGRAAEAVAAYEQA